MAVNCSSTKMGVIDANGNFSLYDIAFEPSNFLARETSVLDAKFGAKVPGTCIGVMMTPIFSPYGKNSDVHLQGY